MKTFDLTINELVQQAYENSHDHGFWEGVENNNIPTKLALIHSEISEALEAFRSGDYAHMKEELADTFIRLGDLCGRLGFNMNKAISDKMEFNKTRPYRHGKKF